MFYLALKEGLIDPATSIQIGVRTHNADTHGVNIRHAPWVMHNGPEATADEIRRVEGDRKANLTFDIDCLDPAFAPGTGTPVPRGLSTLTALEIIRRLPSLDIVGMDVVEVAPAYDVSDITALSAAKIAIELLCLAAAFKSSVQS